MPTFKNIHDKPIIFSPDGPGTAETVEPGKTFELTEKQVYLVGTQISPAHVEEQAAPEEKKAGGKGEGK